MAAKERKTAIQRHLSKESLSENDKSIPLETQAKKRGRKPNSEKAKLAVKEPLKRTPRRKKADIIVNTDDGKPTTPRSRKAFLEKELEDILENATGRNTPLDDRAALFLPKSRREPEEDTLSVRSLSLLRTRRAAEIEDDVLSLRSIKLKKDDDDTMSVRSLPGKPGRKPKTTLPVKTKGPGRPRKTSDAKSVTPKRKTIPKIKETKKSNKKPIRLQNKIGVKRSNLLIKKKVRNAKIAVKRIYRKKAAMRDSGTTVEKAASPSIDETPEVKPETESKEAKEGLPVTNVNGDVLVSVGKKPAVSNRRRLIRGLPVNPNAPLPSTSSTPEPTIPANGVQGRRKRRWESAIHFESTRSPDDSSVIIVQPRLGPKIQRKTVPIQPLPELAPVVPSNGPSTPYYIQTVPNLNALKSQPTAQGDWLVTPSGVVLIQAVSSNDRSAHIESITTSVTTSTCVTSQAVASSEASSCSVVVSMPLASPVSLVATAPTSLPSGSVVEPPPTLSVSAVAPSPTPSSSTLSPTLSGSAVAPSPSPNGVTVANSMLSEKAREAEPAHAGALPRIPVAKNVHELLVMKSRMEEEGPVTSCDEKITKKSSRFSGRSNVGERRASHDGSFGPLPKRLLRRTGSCDRLAPRSPRAILQLGSEPLPLTDAVLPFETDTTFSLHAPIVLPSSSLLEPEVLLASEPAPSASPKDSQISAKLKSESLLDEQSTLKEEVRGEELTKQETNSNNGSAVRCLSPMKEEKVQRDLKPVPGLNSVLLTKSGARTKKYSRSLDSRQTLLPGVRRRSHPEPRVINIVTAEDGSRKGPTLAEELRNECSPRKETDQSATMQVPYLQPCTSPKPVIEESPEDLINKENILSALGLRSWKAAEEMERRKREQQLSLANTSNISSGTLKTVIKIQRPEKKGNGRMIYKASSSAGATVETGTDHDDSYPVDSSLSKESQESGDEEGKNGNGKAKALVIPEKASSFSIHPHRVCSDVCTYCFGKFGLLDTPCHIAQLKDSEKKRNILDVETHLTLESCLCDACFRHVDKKSNGPSFTERKPGKRKLMVQKVQRCCVEGCDLEAQHNVRRKSLLKLKKSLGKKLVLDQVKLDKLQPAHLVTLCNRHIYWVDYYMNCGICNKRLTTSVHMYRIGPEVLELNGILRADGIPVLLTEKRFLCKLCQCYSSIRLKNKDPSDMSFSQRQFYESCRRRILQSHGIDVPDSETEVDVIGESGEKKSKPNKKLKPSSTVTNGVAEHDPSRQPTKASEDLSDLRAKFKPLPAPESGFHKCNTTIQFTKDTKDLFYQLQRPYGNHSSFFRHLVMLEKYFRSGDLVLSRKADPLAVKYVTGVQNRLKSYDGVPQVSSRPFTLTPVPGSHAASSSASSSSSASTPAPLPPTPVPLPAPSSTSNPLSQLQSTVHNIGIKPDISISSVGSEPRKLTPKIQENLRALASRAKPGGQTRAVILNRTVGGQKQSLVQVTTGGKTIHLTLSQFRRIQQMQIRKKQYLESQAKNVKAGKSRTNGPSSSESSDSAFPNIPKALSVSVTKVPAVDLTHSPPRPD